MFTKRPTRSASISSLLVQTPAGFRMKNPIASTFSRICRRATRLKGSSRWPIMLYMSCECAQWAERNRRRTVGFYLLGKDGMGVKFENATETAEVDQAGKHQM